MEKAIKAPRLEPRRKGKMAALAKSVRRNWMLLLMVLPGILWCAIFRYGPMYGALIAFQKYHIGDSILTGNWAGLYWFKKFFSHPQFKQLITNTLAISILQLVFVFPVPIIFALLLNEVRNTHVKKLVQTVSYLPHFISLVAVCSMLNLLLKMKMKKGTADLNFLFVHNMPLRAIAKMTNGMVSMGMIDGLVMELKGFWVIGLCRMGYEFVRNLILNGWQEKRLDAADR